MATLRKWLTEEKFDWETGRIALQSRKSRYSEPNKASFIPFDHPEMDKAFDDGCGLFEAPMFVAEDKDRIYIADDYDGSSSLVAIFKDVSKYLDFKANPIPHVGGGG